MAHKYLGETFVPISETPFRDYTPTDWALLYIGRYGQTDGAHHKQWVLDQVARLLKGAPIVEMRIAKWDDGTEEYRFDVGSSPEYVAWVEEMKGDTDEDGEREYGYDEGIPP